MKIGIVTIVDYTNYGNRLQNYALSKVLQSRFGCKVKTLASYRKRPFYNGNYVGWLKDQIAGKLCVFPTLMERRFGPSITRWANFHKWSKKIPTKNFYNCKMLPEKLNEKYDYFIVGSDQVWNYNFASPHFLDFFLEFAEDKKKIALSGSFGVEEIPEIWKKVYTEGLGSFPYLSVREEAGRGIIKKLLGKDIPVLIDPTMMLSKKEWLKVAKKPRVDCTKPYILKYYLGSEEENEKIDQWAKEHGYEVYELMNESIPELYSAGPGEFISLISNASLVCSDSFHCIVFSIIFSRPFVVYERKGKEDYMTSRLDTLLSKFGFKNRWKHMLPEEEYLRCDFTEVEAKLKKEQEKLLEYVSSALK